MNENIKLLESRKFYLQSALQCMKDRLDGAKQYIQPSGFYRLKNGPPSEIITVDINGIIIPREELDQYNRDAKELLEINQNFKIFLINEKTKCRNKSDLDLRRSRII